MAIYHDADAAKHSPLHRAAYAERYKGGQDDMHAKQALSGIYRCSCGVEIVHVLGSRFPPSHDARMADHPVIWALKVLPHHENDEPSKAGKFLQKLALKP